MTGDGRFCVPPPRDLTPIVLDSAPVSDVYDCFRTTAFSRPTSDCERNPTNTAAGRLVHRRPTAVPLFEIEFQLLIVHTVRRFIIVFVLFAIVIIMFAESTPTPPFHHLLPCLDSNTGRPVCDTIIRLTYTGNKSHE